eukprot:ctg_4316.g443
MTVSAATKSRTSTSAVYGGDSWWSTAGSRFTTKCRRPNTAHNCDMAAKSGRGDEEDGGSPGEMGDSAEVESRAAAASVIGNRRHARSHKRTRSGTLEGVFEAVYRAASRGQTTTLHAAERARLTHSNAHVCHISL